MHQAHSSRVLAWCLPAADGVNHRPFCVRYSMEGVNVWKSVSERKPELWGLERWLDSKWQNITRNLSKRWKSRKKKKKILWKDICYCCHSTCRFSLSQAGERSSCATGRACLHYCPVSQEHCIVGRPSKSTDFHCGAVKTASPNPLKPQMLPGNASIRPHIYDSEILYVGLYSCASCLCQ